MLVSTKEIIEKASKENFAVLAPGIPSLDLIRVTIEAAWEEKVPIIISYHASMLNRIDIYEFGAVTKNAARDYDIPVALHLDHGTTFESCIKAIHAQFDSIMIDRFSKDYKKNIGEIKELIKIAHSVGVAVETELGHILPDGSYDDKGLIDPNLAAEHVKDTNVDFLGPVVVSGLINGNDPRIEFEMIKEVKEKTRVPLVLHGGTAAGDQQLRKACSLGITKVNIDYEPDVAAATGLKSDSINEKDSEVAQRMMFAKEKYKEKIRHYIRVINFKSN